MSMVATGQGKKTTKKSILLIGGLSMAVFMIITVLIMGARHAMMERITERADSTLVLAYQATEDFYARYTILFKALSGMESVRAYDYESVTRMFIRMGLQFPEMVNFAAVDRHGKFFASGRPFDPDNSPSISHLDFFKKLSKGDERAVMNPHMGPISKVKVTGVVVPIADNHGRFDGLVGVSIRFSALTDLWKKTLPAPGTFDFIVSDSKGVIQFTSFKQEAFSFLEFVVSGIYRKIDGRLYYVTQQYSPASSLTLYIIAPMKVPLIGFFRENRTLMLLNMMLLMVLLLFLVHTRRSAELMAVISASEEKYTALWIHYLPS